MGTVKPLELIFSQRFKVGTSLT